MHSSDRVVHTQHFVEEVAIYFEREGMPRMLGRILGHLLVCSPPHQSSAELADALHASRGAISTATRSLLQAELIQRKPVPGSRSMYFEIRPGTMDALLHSATSRVRQGREMIDRGLRLIADQSPEERRRLEEFRDVFAFMEREYPKLIERWDAERAQSTSPKERR